MRVAPTPLGSLAAGGMKPITLMKSAVAWASLTCASQAALSGGRASFGPSAWVSADGIDIVLVSKRQQTFAPDAFTGLGITLEDKRIVVVKSMQHFHAAFAPIAGAIRYVSAPGAIPPDYEKIPFTKRTLPYWPRTADPFSSTNQV